LFQALGGGWWNRPKTDSDNGPNVAEKITDGLLP
jgi:hypothetical protein